MSDEIKGLAVLDDRVLEHILFAVCVPDKGQHQELNAPFIMRLPVRGAGSAKTTDPQWSYQVAGATLQMSPSVRVSTNRPVKGREADYPKVAENIELFHNGGSWSVPFVRWSQAPDKLPDDHPWDYCGRVNAALLA